MKLEKIKKCLLIVMLLGFSMRVWADIDEISKKLSSIVPTTTKIESIAESEMPGVYLVNMGRQTVFVYSIGDHLLVGEAFDTIKKTSLLKEYKSKKMQESLIDYDESKMIVMGDEVSERFITVFTDIDCGYCRKLHFETVPKLIDAGIKVRYMLWPRSGLKGESYNKAVSAYCADDQVKALGDAKAGKPIEEKTCDNPVKEHFQIGVDAGVRGTPNIVLDNGKIIPGFVPAQRIIAQLNIKDS